MTAFFPLPGFITTKTKNKYFSRSSGWPGHVKPFPGYSQFRATMQWEEPSSPESENTRILSTFIYQWQTQRITILASPTISAMTLPMDRHVPAYSYTHVFSSPLQKSETKKGYVWFVKFFKPQNYRKHMVKKKSRNFRKITTSNQIAYVKKATKKPCSGTPCLINWY